MNPFAERIPSHLELLLIQTTPLQSLFQVNPAHVSVVQEHKLSLTDRNQRISTLVTRQILLPSIILYEEYNTLRGVRIWIDELILFSVLHIYPYQFKVNLGLVI